MHTLRLDYPDDLLLTTGKSPDKLEDQPALLLGVKLFELRRLSLGKAAVPGTPQQDEFSLRAGPTGRSSH